MTSFCQLCCPFCSAPISASHIICHVDILLGEVNRGAPDYIAHAVCPACQLTCHYCWLNEFPDSWRQQITTINMLPLNLSERIERPIDRKLKEQKSQ